MQVIIVLLRSAVKYTLFSVIPKGNAFRTPFLSAILKDENVYKRKENPWSWNVAQLTVFLVKSILLECWVPGFAVLPWFHSSCFPQGPFWNAAAESQALVWRELSRNNLWCLSKMQSDTKHPAQPPLGRLGHRTHFSGWKADSDTASSHCVSSGSPGRRGGGTNGRARLEPTFNDTKWDVGHVKVTSDCPNHSKWHWSIVKSTEPLGSV